MEFKSFCYYESPLGRLLLSADEIGMNGLWFEGQRYAPLPLAERDREGELPVLQETKHWLDLYFSGKEPPPMPPLHFLGTPFQNEVWSILLTIPYGQTVTYGEIASLIAERRGISYMSAQAVGGAVGRNRLTLLVPCHRVLGVSGTLTGYAGGPERKRALLLMEGVSTLKKD